MIDIIIILINKKKKPIMKDESKKIINFDEIPIKSSKLIEINTNNEKQNNKINGFKLEKNSNSYQNIDDIVIKPSSSNFMELLEKNLTNEEKKILPNDTKEISENTNMIENKTPPITKDINNKKSNLEINGPSMERMLKQEKIRLNKERAKEIEKNAHLNNTSNINLKNKKTEKKISSNFNNINKINDNNYNKSNFDKKMIQINKSSNNNPIKINQKIQSKWSKAKFGTLEENEPKGYKSPVLEQKNNANQKKRATSFTKNKNMFRNKNTIDLNNRNNNKKVENENDIILNYMNKEIKEREMYNKKLNEYNTELTKVEKEKEKLKKLKEDYETLSLNLQKEKAIYNMQKEEEKRNFDNFIRKKAIKFRTKKFK